MLIPCAWANIKEDPTDFDDTVLRDIETWKRWNSFVSGLVARGCPWWIFLAYYEVSAGLETVSQDEPTTFDVATVF